MITGLVAPNWYMVVRLSVHDTSDEQETLTLAAKLPRHGPIIQLERRPLLPPGEDPCVLLVKVVTPL